MMELAPKEANRVNLPSPTPAEASRHNNNSSGDSFLPQQQPDLSPYCPRLRVFMKSLLSKYLPAYLV